MSDGWATVLVGVVMVVGLVGTVVPIAPGTLIIWAAAVVYGLLVGFGVIGWVVVLLLTALVAVAFAAGIVLPRRMAEGEGVSGWSQLAAAVGAVVGFFVIPYVGLIVGALVGILVAEFVNHREPAAAWRSTVAVAKGFGLATLVEMLVALIMVALWSVWAVTVVL